MIYRPGMAAYFNSFAPAAPAQRKAAAEPFVTISREYGAGGHALAEALLARLAREKEPEFSGWRVFDRALCEQVASDPGLSVSLESLVGEEFHEGFDDYLRTVFAGGSPQTKIDRRVFRTIRSVCSLGKAVVVGRGAALVTRDLPRGIRVRLVSSRENRVKRIVRDGRVSAAAALQSIERRDAHRARMATSYFKQDIADPLLYDCVWNADSASLEEIAESLFALIRSRAAAG
jgi:cytidylate kinase